MRMLDSPGVKNIKENNMSYFGTSMLDLFGDSNNKYRSKIANAAAGIDPNAFGSATSKAVVSPTGDMSGKKGGMEALKPPSGGIVDTPGRQQAKGIGKQLLSKQLGPAAGPLIDLLYPNAMKEVKGPGLNPNAMMAGAQPWGQMKRKTVWG